MARPAKRRTPDLPVSLLKIGKRAPEMAERLAQLDNGDYIDYGDYGSPMLRLTKVHCAVL